MDLVALLGLGLILTTVAANDLNDVVRGKTDSLKLLVDRLDRLTIDFYTLESKLNVKMQTMFDELKSAINNMQALPIGTTHEPELQQNMKSIIEESVQKQAVIVYKAFEAEKRQLRKLKSDIQSDLVTFKSTAHDRFTSINETLDRFVQVSQEMQKETLGYRHEVNIKIDEIKADMHDYDNTLKNVNETLALGTEVTDRNSNSISSISSRVVSNEMSISSLSMQMSSSASDISQLSSRVSSNTNSISSQSSRISDLYLKLGYCTRPSDNNNGVSDRQYYKSGEKIKCVPDFQPATESVCQDGRWSQEPRCVTTLCFPPTGPGHDQKQQYKDGERFECAADYVSQGKISICNMGQWSQQPRCVYAEKLRYRIRFRLPDDVHADDDPDHRLSIALFGKNGHHTNTTPLPIDFSRQINDVYENVSDIGTIGRIEVSGISRVPDFISITNADTNEYYIFRPAQEGSMISNQSITLYPEGGQCSFQAHKRYPLWIRGTYIQVNTASLTDCNVLCLENKSCAWTYYFNGSKPCYHLISNSRRIYSKTTMYLKICQI